MRRRWSPHAGQPRHEPLGVFGADSTEPKEPPPGCGRSWQHGHL